MPFEPHFRITASGRLGTPEGDRWSYNINMARQDGTGIPGLQPNSTVWTDVANDIKAFHSRNTTSLSEYALLDTVKVARIGADGHYLEDPVIVGVSPAVGGAATKALVGSVELVTPQSALAVSLLTNRRGPTGKGRFYLPMPVTSAIATDGFRISTANANSVRDSAQTLLNNLNNQPGIDVLGLVCVVASSKGYNTPVSGVRVGRIVDTIRSRRNNLAESYTTVAAIDLDG